MKHWFIIMICISLCGCQNNVDSQIDDTPKNELKYKEENIEKLQKKIHKLSYFYTKEVSETLLTQVSSLQSEEKFGKLEIDQMTAPFLHPNGNSQEDLSLKNIFFNLLEMMETLRYLLESYNKFIIHNNLIFLTHPAQMHHTNDLKKMINYRKIVRKEILFVKNAIKNYNQQINTYFPNVSDNDKMAGYYSFDNSHTPYNQEEFSIEDIDNFSYSYHNKLITKNLLKLKNPKTRLYHPELGSRQGTVFLESGKPTILRNIFSNGFGPVNLGTAVGMTIEYAITGKIYYYKGGL